MSLSLDATEVNHRYGGVAALAGVSVHVAEGTVVALVGETGSGFVGRCDGRPVAEGTIRRLEDNAGRRHAI